MPISGNPINTPLKKSQINLMQRFGKLLKAFYLKLQLSIIQLSPLKCQLPSAFNYFLEWLKSEYLNK